MRLRILFVGVLVAVLLVSAVSIRARADATVSFGSTVREAAVDTNGNGLYDELQITVDVVVNVSGSYLVSFSAQSATLGFGFQTVQEDFILGTHAVTFTLYGPTLYEYHLDGPYNVSITVTAGTGCIRFCPPNAALTYQTHAYRYTQFDPPYAYVSGPITDSGRDTDGDGYYNLLVVDVPITVNETTEFSANVQVTSGMSNAGGLMTGGAAKTYAPGNYVLEFTFDGRAFYYYKASGPYSVQGSLDLVGIGYAGGIIHTTAAHPYTAFQRPDADFAGPLTYDALGTNGSYDALRIHVPVRVTVAGDYLFQSDLGYGYGSGTNVYRAVHLAPGPTTVDLDYNGIGLSRLSSDGPWYGSVMVERLGGPVYDANQTLFTTPAYTRSEFASRPVSTLTLSVTVSGCTINCLYSTAAYDPSNGFIQWEQPGANSLTLYDGTFEVLISGIDGSVVKQVTVAGNQQLNVAMAPPPTSWVNQTFDFVSVNESVLSTSYTTWGGAPAARWWADLDGNHDGIANTTELAPTAEFYLNWQGGASLDLDNQPYPNGPAAVTGVIGSGPVIDGAPLTVQDTVDFRFPELPSPSFPKNITILLASTPPTYRAFYDFELPAGTVASLTTTNPGTLTRVSATEWTLLAAAPTFQGYPQRFSVVSIEVGSGTGGGGMSGSDALVFLLLIVVPIAVAVVVLVIALRRIPRKLPAAPPPTG